MDQFDGTLFESVLPQIQDAIECIARDLYFRTRAAISVSVDDLIQEGLIGAWTASTRYDESKIANKHSLHAYCKIYAKAAMLRYIEKHKPDLSLEAYLEIDTDKGVMHCVIEGKPIERTETPKHKKVAILNALSNMSKKQRLAIMSFFQIEDEQGAIIVEAETGLSHPQYLQSKGHGLMKLRTLLKLEDLVLA